MTARDIVMSAAGNAGDGKTYIEDVFSTYLYTGNGTQGILVNNGIDLTTKGGMVWVKSRSAAGDNTIADTARGVYGTLVSNSTAADSGSLSVDFNTILNVGQKGFTAYASPLVTNGTTYASWTFRKAPKFFDVVTYTGNGVAGRTISHSLGQAPGMVIVKSTNYSGGSSWLVYHRSLGATKYLALDTTNSAGTTASAWNNTEPTDSNFTVGTSYAVNNSGNNYVAYLFAHDTTTDGLIQCGSFTTDASGNATVNLGWEPQYILAKTTVVARNWYVGDVMRGMPAIGDSSSSTAALFPNTSGAESLANEPGYVSATGFGMTVGGYYPSTTYIYMAIRRGPMRTPTDGTKVFNVDPTYASTSPAYVSNFPVDWALIKNGSSLDPWLAGTRLLGATSLSTNSSSGEAAATRHVFPYNNGWFESNGSSYTTLNSWMFRRAPGFFDVVCYTGTGATSQNVNHNLGVAPELIICKKRSSTSDWLVYSAPVGNTKALYLNATLEATAPAYTYWNNTTPTNTTFNPGLTNTANENGSTHVAYLFASCPGVSKVGSYTGNGSSQTINCGFTNGARFVLIKRTDSTGDWYVWDTARGIVAANDPRLSLNTTAAEVTTDDTIDPASTGFIVNQVSATNINVNAATYIYLAIA